MQRIWVSSGWRRGDRSVRSYLRAGGMVVALMVGGPSTQGSAVAGEAAAPSRALRVLTVWADGSKPDSAISRVNDGQEVAVEIKNPNTFRDKYRVVLDGVDYYTTEVPDLLKGTLLASVAASAPLPVADTGTLDHAQRLFDASDLGEDARGPSSLRDELLRSAGELMGAVRAVEAAALVPHTPAEMTSRLKQALVDMPSNDRAAAVTENLIREYRKEWDLKTDFATDNAPGAFQEAFKERVTELRRDWTKAKGEWDDAYLRWLREASPGETPAFDVKSLAALVTDVESRASTLFSRMDATAAELVKFTELVRIARDPVLTPIEIVVPRDASGDELIAAVTIERTSATADASAPRGSSLGPEVHTTHVDVHGRWLVTFSGGFAATGLRESHYTTAPSADTTGTGKVVIRGARDAADIRPALFAHVFRTYAPAGIPLAFGGTLGIATGDPARYLGGLTVMFGRRCRFGLSGGGAVGKTSVLNGERVGRQLINESPDTKSVTRASWFVSLNIAVASLPGFGSKDDEEKK